LNSYQQLISVVQAGGLILTANERLFRHLRDRYDQAMQDAGKQVWDTPQIISYSGWLSRGMEQLGENWRVLEKHQAIRLWEQLIETSCRGTELELLQLTKTAEKAYEAYQLLKEFDVNLQGCFLTEDQRFFQRWAQLFEAECRRQQWLNRSELPAYICRVLEDGRLLLPAETLLVGFDQLPPGCEMLIATCQKLGLSCRSVTLQAASEPLVSVYAAPDEDREIRQAARWARQLLDQGKKSIGVVVFDLQVKRRKIERIFRDQIDPAAGPGLLDEEANFTLSLGAPLAEQGVIHAACELLSLGQQLSLDQAAFLLRTPYLAGSLSESDGRAALENELRSFRQSQLKLHRIQDVLTKRYGHLKCLLGVCVAIGKFTKDQGRHLPGVWAEKFANQLNDLGWPGERSPASSEYQAIKAWRDKLLPTLAALDAVSSPMERKQALAMLRRLAADIDFQLESPTGPLQVMGQLESGGLSFDHLWVLGLSENVLPAAARPNPFLPLELQQSCGMPHASAERELQFAEQVVERLRFSSPRIVFSYPQQEGDCELTPSPLLPEANTTETIAFAEPQDALYKLSNLQTVLPELQDDQGPPLPDGKGQGGTGILKDQAHCPFRAFVHHRLQGRQQEQASPGLDAMTRGDLVHQVLEQLWQKLLDQQALLDLSESEQAQLLEEVIEASVETYFSRWTPVSAQLLSLEKQRLTLLVGDWLNSVERQRDPFRILEMERKHVEQLGPLELTTKIDRVDELPDGSRVVLDYKTGRSLQAEDLLTEPLLEPQLPIYAVADQGAEADAVVFAQVLRNDCRLLGVVREKGMLGRVKPLAAYPQAAERNLDSWEQLLGDWRRQLEGLAADFVAGRAEVKPFDRQRCCQYCDLPGLCRINEADTSKGGRS